MAPASILSACGPFVSPCRAGASNTAVNAPGFISSDTATALILDAHPAVLRAPGLACRPLGVLDLRAALLDQERPAHLPHIRRRGLQLGPGPAHAVRVHQLEIHPLLRGRPGRPGAVDDRLDVDQGVEEPGVRVGFRALLTSVISAFWISNGSFATSPGASGSASSGCSAASTLASYTRASTTRRARTSRPASFASSGSTGLPCASSCTSRALSWSVGTVRGLRITTYTWSPSSASAEKSRRMVLLR